MNIKIVNSKGDEVRIGSKSDGLCLTELPDWGTVPYVFNSVKHPMQDGEEFKSGRLGVRDIILKFEARSADARRVFSILSPGEAVRINIDGRWYIDGRVNGILNTKRLYKVIPLQMSLSVRCFDPYFYKTGGERRVAFTNSSTHLYDTEGYLYTQIDVYNHGDVPCPMEMSLISNYSGGNSGLFTTALWNDGVPVMEGFFLKKPVTESEIHVNTNYFGNHADWYGLFVRPCLVWLNPGKNTFYALNCRGEICINPRFLTCEEGLCKDRF